MRIPTNRNFRLLWTGSVVSSFGSWLLIIAAPVQVFHLTGSALATGLTLAVESVPAMLLGPWVGVLVDHWDRRRILIGANVASAAGVALILLGDSPDRVGYIYAGLLLEHLAVVFLHPAMRSVLPAILGTGDDLASANSLSAFTGSVMRLAGPPLGTLLLAWGGIGAVVGIDVASYLIAAALTARVVVTSPARQALNTRDVPARLREGLRYLARSRVLRGMLVASWIYWAANAALTALLVPFVVQRLGRDGGDLGYLIAALGAGYLIGSAISRPLLSRYTARRLLTCTYAAVGLSFLVLFNASELWVAMLGAAASGVPGAVATVATQHRIQVETSDEVLGRVGSVYDTSDATAAVTGALAAPLVVAATSLPVGLNLVSGVVITVAAVALVMIGPPPS